MYILECGDYKDLIVWKPNGLSFDIINPKVFEKKVLRGICEGIKFTTFQRKVSIQCTTKHHGRQVRENLRACIVLKL